MIAILFLLYTLIVAIIQGMTQYVYKSYVVEYSFVKMKFKRIESTMLLYPLYVSDASDLIVWPMRILQNFSVPMIQPIGESGVVFHVYAAERCRHNKYMSQVEYNAKLIKEAFSNV